jgi:predicted transport protein
MSESKLERFFCNVCKGKTKHFVRSEFNKHDEKDEFWFKQRLLIVECCGCENIELVKQTLFSEDVDYSEKENWDEVIYPPVTYRVSPVWFEDLPDPTLRQISQEIYKSLQTESHYLATFGSRTLIDRLIVLTVGDKGNFPKGLEALQAEGKLSQHEREILEPVVQAGHAAAHRGWAPTREQLAIILDTVEGLIHRLLVLPKMAEELDEAVPYRTKKDSWVRPTKLVVSVKDKLAAAPKDLRGLFDELDRLLRDLGKDVSVHPQKHYIAYRRNRNFASVQIYNRKKIIRIYLNIDPDNVTVVPEYMRDVRQIGHFGTGDLEVSIEAKREIERAIDLIKQSYEAS